MAIFRKSKRSSSAFERKLRRIEEEERKYKQLMEEAADPRPILPPPDEFRRFRPMCRLHVDAAMPRQVMRQEKRFQLASLLLFIVLSIATLAAAMWMLRLAQM